MRRLLMALAAVAGVGCAGMTQEEIDSIAAGINQGVANFQQNYHPPKTCYTQKTSYGTYQTQCY